MWLGERIPPEADALETHRQQPAVHVCVLAPHIVPWHFINGPLMVLKVWDETGAVTKEKTLRASLFISLKWESLSNSQLLMVSRVLKHMGRGYLFIFFPPFFCHFPLDAGISPSVSVTAADGSTILWRTQTNTNTETLAQSTSTPDRDAASEKKKKKKLCECVSMCIC